MHFVCPLASACVSFGAAFTALGTGSCGVFFLSAVRHCCYLVVISLNDCLRGMFFVLILVPAESTAAYTEVTKSYQTACEQLAAVENIQRQLDTSSNHELAKQVQTSVQVWVKVVYGGCGVQDALQPAHGACAPQPSLQCRAVLRFLCT